MALDLNDIDAPSTTSVKLKAKRVAEGHSLVVLRVDELKMPAAQAATALHDSRKARKLKLFSPDDLTFTICAEADKGLQTISNFSFKVRPPLPSLRNLACRATTDPPHPRDASSERPQLQTPSGPQSHTACTLLTLYPPAEADGPYVLAGFAVDTSMALADPRAAQSEMTCYGALVEPLGEAACRVTLACEFAPGVAEVDAGGGGCCGGAASGTASLPPSCVGHALAAFLQRLADKADADTSKADKV